MGPQANREACNGAGASWRAMALMITISRGWDCEGWHGGNVDVLEPSYTRDGPPLAREAFFYAGNTACSDCATPTPDEWRQASARPAAAQRPRVRYETPTLRGGGASFISRKALTVLGS